MSPCWDLAISVPSSSNSVGEQSKGPCCGAPARGQGQCRLQSATVVRMALLLICVQTIKGQCTCSTKASQQQQLLVRVGRIL